MHNSQTSQPKLEDNTTKIIIAIISALAIIVAGIIAYFASIKQVLLPIEATQTAEAMHTAIALETQSYWTFPTSTPVLPNTATNTATPLQSIITPTLTIIVVQPTQSESLVIEELTFCEPQFFDASKNSCIASQQVFLQGKTKIYVSWKYKGILLGNYSRRWYWNGTVIESLTRIGISWGLDGQSDFTFVSSSKGIEKGEYTLEFHLESNDQLIYKGTFYVQ